jgi:hypothetical protein
MVELKIGDACGISMTKSNKGEKLTLKKKK